MNAAVTGLHICEDFLLSLLEILSSAQASLFYVPASWASEIMFQEVGLRDSNENLVVSKQHDTLGLRETRDVKNTEQTQCRSGQPAGGEVENWPCKEKSKGTRRGSENAFWDQKVLALLADDDTDSEAP